MLKDEGLDALRNSDSRRPLSPLHLTDVDSNHAHGALTATSIKTGVGADRQVEGAEDDVWGLLLGRVRIGPVGLLISRHATEHG